LLLRCGEKLFGSMPGLEFQDPKLAMGQSGLRLDGSRTVVTMYAFRSGRPVASMLAAHSISDPVPSVVQSYALRFPGIPHSEFRNSQLKEPPSLLACQRVFREFVPRTLVLSYALQFPDSYCSWSLSGHWP
jgi:hypothetical protein